MNYSLLFAGINLLLLCLVLLLVIAIYLRFRR